MIKSNWVNTPQIQQTSSRLPYPRFDIQSTPGIFHGKVITVRAGKLFSNNFIIFVIVSGAPDFVMARVF